MSYYNDDVLSPTHSEREYIDKTFLIELNDAKEYIGLSLTDTSVDDTLNKIIGMIEELVSEWLGTSLIQTKFTDYFYASSAKRFELSSKRPLSHPLVDTDAIESKLQIVEKGDTDFTDVDSASWVLDETSNPTTVLLKAPLVTSSDNLNPVRFVYSTKPFTEVKLGLIQGTILDIVKHKYQTRSQPADLQSENAIRRSLAYNLGSV